MSNANPDVVRLLRKGLTVKELRDELSQYDENMVVGFKYNSQDYWKTIIAQPVSQFDIEGVKYSGYHSKLAVDEDGESEQEMLILS